MTKEHHGDPDDRLETVVADVAKIRQQLEDGSIMLPNGKLAAEAIREHDDLVGNQQAMLGQQTKMINLFEGQPVLSAITGQPTGERETGVIDKIDYLYQGANGGSPVRFKREWTTTQMWTIGLVVFLLTGIFLAMIPIVTEIVTGP